MIASHRNDIPAIQVAVPPAIHVHPAEVKPVIHVHPADNPTPVVTIENREPKVTVNPIINVAPAPVNMPEAAKRCSWRHEVHRDTTGRIETIISTPMENS